MRTVNESKQNLELSILNEMEDTIYIATPETYELIFVNKSFEKSWGKSVIGKKCYKVLQNRNDPCPFCTNHIIFGEKPGENYVWEFQNQVTKRWYRCSDKAIKWTDGKLVRFEIAADITEKKIYEFKLTERIKEISCLHEVSDLINNPNLSFDDTLQNAIDSIPSAFQQPNNTFARIEMNGKLYVSSDFKESKNFISTEIKLDKNKEGGILTIFLINTGTKIEKLKFISEEKELIKMLGVLFENYLSSYYSEHNLKESEARFRSFFENSVIGKSIIGIDGSLIVNNAFAEMLGYTIPEMLEKKWTEITHPDDIKVSKNIVQKIKNGEIQKAKYRKRYLHKQGHVVWTELSTTLVRDLKGTPLYFISTINNISQQKEFEERLKKKSEELSRSNKELEQFAYVASHDLQEPLRMVSSYTHLLQKHYEGALDEKADMYIHYAIDGAIRMQTLINDLLDFSRISTRGKDFSETDCNIILANALINLKSLIEDSKAIVTHKELPFIYTDPVQFIRIFQNLISNAIKFRGEENPLIQVNCTEETNNFLFSVKDNGIGIDSKYKDKIFVIFQRLHSREEYEGTGIGLSICKRIVNRHGGKIWFKSEPGSGTTFYFTIPKNKKNE